MFKDWQDEGDRWETSECNIWLGLLRNKLNSIIYFVNASLNEKKINHIYFSLTGPNVIIEKSYCMKVCFLTWLKLIFFDVKKERKKICTSKYFISKHVHSTAFLTVLREAGFLIVFQ